jgi:ribosome-associated protein
MATENESRAKRPFRLDQFLKYSGITATGGQAKQRIQAGEVRVNGEIETRRGHLLAVGDRIEVDGRSWTVE